MTNNKKNLSLLTLCALVAGSSFSALLAEDISSEVRTMETTTDVMPEDRPMMAMPEETDYSYEESYKGAGKSGKSKRTVKTTKEKKGFLGNVLSAPARATDKTVRGTSKVVRGTSNALTGKDKKVKKHKTVKTKKTKMSPKPKNMGYGKGSCPCPRSVQESKDYSETYE